MSAQSTLFTQLDDALLLGSTEWRANTLRQLTDLFLFGADRFSENHLALFDDIFARFISSIEVSARAALAQQLADIANAPPSTIHALAFDDQIDVAGPVLARSMRLDIATLVDSAGTKGQEHLRAIASRKSLDQAVTDVLVQRGNREVVRSLAENPGARFSEFGFSLLVGRSLGDSHLALALGSRHDLSRQHFRQLLRVASPEVRRTLESADRQDAGAVFEDGTAGAVGAEIVKKPRVDPAAAASNGETLLEEREVVGFAQAGRIGEATVVLAKMCDLPIGVVARTLGENRVEMIMVMARAAGFSWEAARAILLVCGGKSGLAEHFLGHSKQTYDRLTFETAQQVLQFQRRRQKKPKPATL